MGPTVSGYPNFFMLYGPEHEPSGGNSIIVILEAQATYVLGALRAMRRHRVRAVDVRRDVMDGYNRELQEALDGTSWNVVTGATGLLQERQRQKIATQLPADLQVSGTAQRARRFRMKEYV